MTISLQRLESGYRVYKLKGKGVSPLMTFAHWERRTAGKGGLSEVVLGACTLRVSLLRNNCEALRARGRRRWGSHAQVFTKSVTYDHLVSVVVADTKVAGFLDAEDQTEDLIDVGEDEDGEVWKVVRVVTYRWSRNKEGRWAYRRRYI